MEIIAPIVTAMQAPVFEPGSWHPELADVSGKTPLDTLRLLVGVFLTEHDVMATTRKTYWDSLQQFIEWLRQKGKDVRCLKPADVMQFKECLRAAGKTPLTVNSYMIALRQFYKWTAARGIYPDITCTVKVKRKGEDKDRFVKMHLTDGEQERLLEYFRTRSIRDYAIAALILSTGLRVIEVTRIDIGDMQTKRGRHIIRIHGKGHDRKDQTAVIRPDIHDILMEYREHCRPCAADDEPLFVTAGLGHHILTGPDGLPERREHAGNRMSTRSIQGFIKRGLKEIGLDAHEYSCHSLRHSFAVNLLHAGVPMDRIQKAMRHESMDTTMIYLQSIAEDERIDNAPELETKYNFKRCLPETAS